MIKKPMTVKEFYEWCKNRKLEDAEIRIADQFLSTRDFPVTEWNIDYKSVEEPHKPKRKVVILGG